MLRTPLVHISQKQSCSAVAGYRLEHSKPHQTEGPAPCSIMSNHVDLWHPSLKLSDVSGQPNTAAPYLPKLDQT